MRIDFLMQVWQWTDWWLGRAGENAGFEEWDVDRGESGAGVDEAGEEIGEEGAEVAFFEGAGACEVVGLVQNCEDGVHHGYV